MKARQLFEGPHTPHTAAPLLEALLRQHDRDRHFLEALLFGYPAGATLASDQHFPKIGSWRGLTPIFEDHHISGNDIASAGLREILPHFKDGLQQPGHLLLSPRWLPTVRHVGTLREEVDVQVDETQA